MKIERFEDLDAWKLARRLTKKVYALTRKKEFSRDFGLKNQIRVAAGSAMHNLAEGFDADSTAEFKEVYNLAGETLACTKGLIKYLQRYAADHN